MRNPSDPDLELEEELLALALHDTIPAPPPAFDDVLEESVVFDLHSLDYDED